ncbi:MAG: hypothetical protein V4616_12095 [Bacteroidota bacterium]
MNKFLLALALGLLVSTAGAQRKIALSVKPADASIHLKKPDGSLAQLGIGNAEVEVEKNTTTTVVIKKDGFNPLEKTYKNFSGDKPPKEDAVELKDRLVTLNVMPYDARVFLDGREVGKGSLDVIIPFGASGTVEVKKTGYVTRTKTYHNKDGFDVPPVSERMELNDRTIQIISNTAESAILVDGKKVSDNNAEVTIPLNACVMVKVSKEGFSEIEKTYCNKEGVQVPPTNESFTLKDRLVMVNATPNNAAIFIDGKEVSKGEFNVKILKGSCVEVLAQLPGYVDEKKTYCNQDNMPMPPLAENLKLTVDEAYTSSVASDQANVNFTIEVNGAKSEDDAWKIMSQIVTGAFDILEIADKETGYIRTAWSVKSFKSNTIRTRVIVKLGDTKPLKYVVKIVSEQSGKPGTSIKEDDSFKSWDRVLNTYKDFINEIQARLK